MTTTRLGRMKEAVESALKGFKAGKAGVSDLAEVLRTELGPMERLFLASAAATALEGEHREKLVIAMETEADRDWCRKMTAHGHRILVDRARAAGDEAKAQKIEAAYDGFYEGVEA